MGLPSPPAQPVKPAIDAMRASDLAYWAQPNFTATNGQCYSWTNGALLTVAGYKCFALPLTGSEIALRLTGTQSGNATALVVFISASGAVLSYDSVGTGANITYNNKEVIVPSGAKTALISGVQGSTLNVQVQTTRQGPPNASVNWIAPASPEQINFYINGSGVATAAGGYKYALYPLDGTEEAVLATGTTNGNAAALAAFFDGQGNFIAGSRQFVGTGANVTYTNQPLNVPSGAASVAICGVMSFALGLRMMKRVKATSVFGDSTAAGLSAVLAGNLPERPLYNQGLGGQTTAQIAARMGATPVTLAAFTLPTSGSVAVTPSIDLLYLYARPNAVSCRVMVLGIPCILACAVTTGAYTLTPLTYPASALNIPAGTVMVVTSGINRLGADPSGIPTLEYLLSGNVVIRAGRNDIGAGGYSQSTLLDYMDGMLAAVTRRGGRALICTVTNGYFDMPISSGLTGAAQSSAANADSNLSQIASLNAAMLAEWPDRALDVIGNHQVLGGTTAQTPLTTTYQVLNTTVMNADGLHESTATGLPRTSALIQTSVQGMGR